MSKKGITRRDVLLGAGAAALTAETGAKASTADLGVFAKRHLTIFRDYAERAFSGLPERTDDRPGASDGASRVLWISDLSPATFAHHGDLAIIRPSALESSPTSVLADLVSAPGPIVVSTPSVRSQGIDERFGLWRRLADLMARPGTPAEVLIDLGGTGGDSDAILDGVDALRRTYARHADDWIAIACPQGPWLRIG